MRFDDQIPIYVQVKDYITKEIISGNYPAAAELPSRRELAKQFQINPNTVQRAFKELEEAELITTEANKASQVTDNQVKIAEFRQKILEQAVEQFYQDVAPLKVSYELVSKELQKRFKDEEVL